MYPSAQRRPHWPLMQMAVPLSGAAQRRHSRPHDEGSSMRPHASIATRSPVGLVTSDRGPSSSSRVSASLNGASRSEAPPSIRPASGTRSTGSGMQPSRLSDNAKRKACARGSKTEEGAAEEETCTPQTFPHLVGRAQPAAASLGHREKSVAVMRGCYRARSCAARALTRARRPSCRLAGSRNCDRCDSWCRRCRNGSRRRP